jgi:rRNA maturation protein Nop10
MPHNHLESKANLAKLASYAAKLAQLSENAHLEDWAEKQITEATNNLATVYHFVEYESKFNDYSKMLKSETLSEGHRKYLTTLLAEAKDKIKDLKKADAEKKSKKIDESVRETTCSECGGTGVVMKPIHPKAKSKLEKYRRETEAFAAAHRRMSKGEENLDEANFDGERGGDQDTPSKFNKQKTSTGTRYTRKSSTFSDEHDGGDGKKSHAKSKSAAEKKAEAPALKKSKTGTWGMEGGQKFDNRKDESVAEGKKPDFLDLDKDGNKKESMKKAASDKKKAVKESAEHLAQLAHHHATEYAKAIREGRVEEALHHKEKCEECGGKLTHNPSGGIYHSHTGLNGGQMYECNAIAPTPAPGGQIPMAEGKPSAGLSKEKKSATVKKAKKGGDIGKPGKNFEKVAKKAGGGEKGEKIAAAAMWKNIKEETAYVEERAAASKKADKDYDGDGKIESGKEEHAGSVDKAIKASKKEKTNESSDFTRMQEQMARLNRSENLQVNESSEASAIRKLTQRLFG